MQQQQPAPSSTASTSLCRPTGSTGHSVEGGGPGQAGGGEEDELEPMSASDVSVHRAVLWDTADGEDAQVHWWARTVSVPVSHHEM